MVGNDGAARYIIRAVDESDLSACAGLDHSTLTEYVWQVDVGDSPEGVTYGFRTIRLPRAMNVVFPQSSASLLVDWEQRDFFVVAEGQGVICAYLNMRVDRAWETGWIRQLVVDRPKRRQRIGSALLRAAEQWARAHGLRRLMIETQTKNHPAIVFCQRHGFAMSGFNDRYYSNQDIAVFFSQSIR